MQNFKTIDDLNIIPGTKVLLRLDLNVPTNENGEVVDDFRIQESKDTIKLLQSLGARVVILAHKEKGSLEKVKVHMEKVLGNGILFDKNIITADGVADLNSAEANVARNLQNGEVLLLENLRTCDAEKSKDEKVRNEFAKKLSLFGEVFINEAFSASHRNHASITSLPKFFNPDKKCLGPKFLNEIKMLSLALKPKHPSLLIVGGAKFDTKLPMIEKFLNVVDKIFIGGALAHSFWKVRGVEIGTSLIDTEVKLSEKVLKSEKIILPIDIMNQNKETKKLDEIKKDDKITDFGENTFASLLNIIDVSETIIWNGPLDYYEAGYDWGTRMLIENLSKLKNKTIILGGGDTVTEINKVKQTNPNISFTHISTGGGAMIDFLSQGTLPGILAIN
jgi:phosphoglycerate kinase